MDANQSRRRSKRLTMTYAARTLQDENINLHYNSGATIGGKTYVSKAQKNVGRKALKDLSNSAKPYEIPSLRKKNSVNNVLNIQEKPQVVARKSLKKIQDVDNKKRKNLIARADEENFPEDIDGGGFMHNHQECVEAQREYFLKNFLDVGLDNMDSSQALTIPELAEMKEKLVSDSELMMGEYPSANFILIPSP